MHYSDIVNWEHIWYRNHTIFGKIKVYFIPYIMVQQFPMYGSAADRRIFQQEKTKKIGTGFELIDLKQWYIDKSRTGKLFLFSAGGRNGSKKRRLKKEYA